MQITDAHTPGFDCAEKITDAHTHIFPAKIALKAAANIGHFYDDSVRMWGDGTAQMLMENSKRAGVTRCFVHSVATVSAQVEKINDFIARSVEESGGLFTGFATMHPDFADISAELDRAKEMGLAGVKIHPDMQNFCIDEPKSLRMLEKIAAKNLPVIAHTGDGRFNFSNPNRVARVKREIPQLTLCAAHLGGYTCWDEVEGELGGLGLYTDCSSVFFAMDGERAVRLIRFFGADRVMFGSDYPMWDARPELKRLLRLPLTDTEKRDILNETAERFIAEK